MEKITTDISSFENLHKDGYVYVDKTDLVDVAKRQVAAGDVDGLVNETLYRIRGKRRECSRENEKS